MGLQRISQPGDAGNWSGTGPIALGREVFVGETSKAPIPQALSACRGEEEGPAQRGWLSSSHEPYQHPQQVPCLVTLSLCCRCLTHCVVKHCGVKTV